MSNSKLATGVYDGIRKAHKEEEKALARHLRMKEREKEELLHSRDKTNTHVSLLKLKTPEITSEPNFSFIRSPFMGQGFFIGITRVKPPRNHPRPNFSSI